MFRKHLIIVCVLSLLAPWKLCWGENFDFRHTRWGMTQVEVIGSEEKMEPVEKTDHFVKYKTQIVGKNVELIFVFAQDKLIGSSYRLDDNYLNSEHFLQTYLQFKQALVKKYGLPDKDTTNWLDETYKKERNKWGLALSLGHTQYAALWNTQNATIQCSLREENYYVLCSVDYKSTDYSHLFEEVKKEDKIDPF